MRRLYIQLWALVAVIAAFVGVGECQSTHKTRPLVINGHSGEAVIYQIDGKSFVDIESLVRIGNGSMSFRGEHIFLVFPTASNELHPESADTRSGSGVPLSADFMKAAVQALGVFKDWTNVLSYAVQRGVPGDGARLATFHDRAAENLRLTKVAAANASDESAVQLLTNEFNTLSKWNDKLVSERRSMNTGQYSLTPDSLQRDETYQKITQCSDFLNRMLPSGQFADDSSCH
jgi:hypothetical protein